MPRAEETRETAAESRGRRRWGRGVRGLATTSRGSRAEDGGDYLPGERVACRQIFHLFSGYPGSPSAKKGRDVKLLAFRDGVRSSRQDIETRDVACARRRVNHAYSRLLPPREGRERGDTWGDTKYHPPSFPNTLSCKILYVAPDSPNRPWIGYPKNPKPNNLSFSVFP